MNPYIFCGVGAVLGWIVGLLSNKTGDRIIVIENVGVGIFGAYIGGEFVVSMMGGLATDTAFHMSSLGYAAAGSATMLGLLWLMRKKVGVLKHSKSRSRN